MVEITKCRICNGSVNKIFTSKVLNKHLVTYYKCNVCGYICTEEPYWLNEAYKNPINNCDTGILMRNNYLAKRASIIFYFLFDKHRKYLDYSGGYGIATRMFRDIGFDGYWDDPMTTNIFAKGFEYKKSMKIEAITAFECFEHFVDPVTELKKMLKISNNIVFSTEILPVTVPDPKSWWYYGFEHGQHVSFYSDETLNRLAKMYGLNYYNLLGVGLITKKKFSYIDIKMTTRLTELLFSYVKFNMKSLTISDMEKINE